jgi:hypothetical protein
MADQDAASGVAAPIIQHVINFTRPSLIDRIPPFTESRDAQEYLTDMEDAFTASGVPVSDRLSLAKCVMGPLVKKWLSTTRVNTYEEFKRRFLERFPPL